MPLSLGGMGNSEKGSKSSEERTSERKYTYGSLLYKLRKSLRERNLLIQIKEADDWQRVNYLDFVEMTGIFKRNPVLDIVSSWEGRVQIDRELKKMVGNQPNDSRDTIVEQQFEFNEWLRDRIEGSRGHIYVVELSQPKEHKVIVSLYTDFLRDQRGNELENGRFTILGKVYRKVSGSESLDLLEKSPLKAINEKVIQSIFEQYKGIREKGINVPDWDREVNAPAMALIPISVFI